MKIRTKFTLINVMIAAFAIIVGVLSFLATKEVKSQYQTLVNDTFPEMEALEKIQFYGLRVVSSTSEIALIMAENENSSHQTSINTKNMGDRLRTEGIIKLKKSLDHYRLHYANSAVRISTLSTLTASAQSLIKQSDKIIDLKKRGIKGDDLINEINAFEEIEIHFLTLTQSAIQNIENQIKYRQIKTQNSIQTSIYIITLFSLLGITASIVLVKLFSLYITKPLSKIETAVKRLGQGDEHIEIKGMSHDEFGQVASSINKMAVDLAELTSKLRYAKETAESAMIEAEQANIAKSEFLSHMSHELRTPLNAISGFSQLLKDDVNTSKKDQQYAANHIFDAGEHLLNLINEILDAAKINAEEIRLSIETTSLESALNESIALVKQLAAAEQITIADLPKNLPWVKADIKRLKQIFVNLLSNAIKYNQPLGSITISLQETQSHLLRINVIDTGIGIKEENQRAVFDPFYRVGNRTDIEGTGIGLSVVKKLVETMNGRIGVNSQFGKGSTFWIELPVSIPTEPLLNDKDISALSSFSGDADMENHNILYIEDNIANQKLMESIFNKLPRYTLFLSLTAEQGIETTLNTSFDLILMDIDLPGMDGFEAFNKLKTCQNTAHIPVIAISAHTMPKHLTQIRTTGFSYYMSKPIHVEQLITNIKRALRT